MGFFSDLMGKTSAANARATGEQNAALYTGANTKANEYSKTGYDTAQNRLMPYAQGGQQGYQTYSNALGLNGEPARQQAFQSFQADPFLAYARQNSADANNSIFRRYNAQGMGNSGASMLAVSRAAGDRAQNDVNTWMNRMMQMGQQGQGIAGQQAGLDTGYYGGMADREVNLGNALANNNTQSMMAQNNARMAGVNNLLQGAGALGGMAISAFAPGAGGMSAAGNFSKMFGGGGGGGGTPWVNPDNGKVWGGY